MSLHAEPGVGIVAGHPGAPATHVFPSHVHGTLGPLGDVWHWHEAPITEHAEPTDGAGEGHWPAHESVQS